jgi:succinyldiaminopimelate transaminase
VPVTDTAPRTGPWWTTRRVSALLPDFPWDRLLPHAATARSHPDGIVDLSVGTPVDPTPEVVQRALRGAADAPGYPTTHGPARLRATITEHLARRLGVPDVDPTAVLPLIGSKELVASLPSLLGLGPADRIAIPELAYPTYEVGALLAGATAVRCDEPSGLDPAGLRMIWLNSPSNPTGAVHDPAWLRRLVAWARSHDVLVVSDECYLELGWEGTPVSVLHPDVCDGDHRGLLAVHSLSKRSNLAGYRAAFLVGDPEIVAELLAVRRHAGMMAPAPVQAAMAAALTDDAHVAEQRERYARRRWLLREALTEAGFTIEHSEAGLYLWATRGQPCWQTVADLATSGILVAPGEFYGPAGARHVRIALTASDERVEAALRRLAHAPS